MLSKITFSRFLTFLTALLVATTLLFYLFFSQTKSHIITNFEQTGLEEVSEVSKNITDYLLRMQDEVTLYHALYQDKKHQVALEEFLSTFQTHKIKNIFVVDKPEHDAVLFRVLLDGGKEKGDKFHFEELFEPENRLWHEVLLTREPKVIYQKDNIEALWATFLYPMIQNDGSVAILALDFSKEHYQKVLSSLRGLEIFLQRMVLFLLLIFGILIVVIRMDIKREQQKMDAQKALEQLNLTLEERIRDEVEKNRQKDRQLIQQSRLASMGEMISMIAHQWRQPLSAISSSVEGLRVKLALKKFDETLFEDKLCDVNGYVQHLSQTIDDFRQFFKESKAKNSVTLERIVERVLGIVHDSLHHKQIDVVLDLQAHVTFMTYSNELMHVLLNLIKNSEDVLMDNDVVYPWIKIATYANETELVLEVSDNGGGIQPEVMERIFEPYFSTKEMKDGTGLGLYMSKKMIEEHCGGKLLVSNNTQGAVFTLLFSR
ncbi:MAG: hypothetical protein EOL93_02260 [Epsilonproteobacteria bacterium]|nr:hypothetical protein [Campylobacterota bacterium]